MTLASVNEIDRLESRELNHLEAQLIAMFSLRCVRRRCSAV